MFGMLSPLRPLLRAALDRVAGEVIPDDLVNCEERRGKRQELNPSSVHYNESTVLEGTRL